MFTIASAPVEDPAVARTRRANPLADVVAALIDAGVPSAQARQLTGIDPTKVGSVLGMLRRAGREHDAPATIKTVVNETGNTVAVTFWAVPLQTRPRKPKLAVAPVEEKAPKSKGK